MDKEFSNQARENLNAKMENYGENREAIMTDMKDKLKVCTESWVFFIFFGALKKSQWIINTLRPQNQFQEIEKTRLTMEQQKNVERVAIDKKLQSAAFIRDENIKKMLERLKEHVCIWDRVHSIAHFTRNETFMLFLKYVFFGLLFAFTTITSAKSDLIWPTTPTIPYFHCIHTNMKKQHKIYTKPNPAEYVHRINWQLKWALMLVITNKRWKNCTFSKTNCS